MSLADELDVAPPENPLPRKRTSVDYSDEAVQARKRDAARANTEVQSIEAADSGDPLAALARYVVTAEQVQQMQQTRMIHPLIAWQHLGVICAPAGDGKTTIACHLAGLLAGAGLHVLYFQEDASAGDLPALFRHAADNGYTLLNSTLANASPGDQLEVLRRLVRSETPLDGYVFILDTLKKFADLMSKGGTREFLRLMRSLTQRGATVILLGHTNKHRGPDGKLMFEGVGDVRNDVDELLYIEATDKDLQGIRTLTIKPDKARCAVREMTYQLDTTTRELRELDHVVNVSALLAVQQQRQDDQPLIDAVCGALSAGGLNYSVLVDRVIKDSGRSRAAVEKVIRRYLTAEAGQPGMLWLETRMRLNNVRHVALMPGEPR